MIDFRSLFACSQASSSFWYAKWSVCTIPFFAFHRLQPECIAMMVMMLMMVMKTKKCTVHWVSVSINTHHQARSKHICIIKSDISFLANINGAFIRFSILFGRQLATFAACSFDRVGQRVGRKANHTTNNKSATNDDMTKEIWHTVQHLKDATNRYEIEIDRFEHCA